ncbi:MAG: helix-turn-helix domain-containing protein [Oscillospiraceae bacterium]|nr:helix-turn-helix domain-containing protein [Oscillospiraceae bacterium]
MTVFDGKFYQMANMIFGYGLTPYEFTVYNYLVCCAGNRGRCYPSMKTIAGVCKCSENTARKAVHALADKKFIRIVETYSDLDNDRIRQTNNTYFILDLPELPEREEKHMRLRYKNSDGSFSSDADSVA